MTAPPGPPFDSDDQDEAFCGVCFADIGENEGQFCLNCSSLLCQECRDWETGDGDLCKQCAAWEPKE